MSHPPSTLRCDCCGTPETETETEVDDATGLCLYCQPCPNCGRMGTGCNDRYGDAGCDTTDYPDRPRRPYNDVMSEIAAGRRAEREPGPPAHTTSMSAPTPPAGLPTTREVFVLDTVDGPELYLSARELAKAVIDGMGFVIVTKTFEATARVLTDRAAPSVELTDLFATACMDHARERSATNGYAARQVVRDQHIDALVDQISQRRVAAQIAAVIGVRP